MIRTQTHHRPDRRGRRPQRHAPHAERRHAPVSLTEEGVPAAVPDAPPPSPVVFVSDEARARHPWLPRRVIAGSVWRGPHHERVRIDESGSAQPWRCGPAVR